MLRCSRRLLKSPSTWPRRCSNYSARSTRTPPGAGNRLLAEASHYVPVHRPKMEWLGESWRFTNLEGRRRPRRWPFRPLKTWFITRQPEMRQRWPLRGSLSYLKLESSVAMVPSKQPRSSLAHRSTTLSATMRPSALNALQKGRNTTPTPSLRTRYLAEWFGESWLFERWSPGRGRY